MKKTTTLLILLLTAALFLINACDSGDDGKKYYISISEMDGDTVTKTNSFSNTERFGFFRNGESDTTWECSWGNEDVTITLPLEDPGSAGDPIETNTLFLSGDDDFTFVYDNGDNIYYAAGTAFFELSLTNWSDTVGDVMSGTFEGELIKTGTIDTIEVDGEFECIMTGVVSSK